MSSWIMPSATQASMRASSMAVFGRCIPFLRMRAISASVRRVQCQPTIRLKRIHQVADGLIVGRDVDIATPCLPAQVEVVLAVKVSHYRIGPGCRRFNVNDLWSQGPCSSSEPEFDPPGIPSRPLW